MDNPLGKVKEVALIERFARSLRTQGPSVIVSIGDDAAAVAVGRDRCLLYTVDMLVESVHFKRGEDPAKVGYKALAASVSDIAAMGGLPKYALVSVGLPPRNVAHLAGGLFQGIARCARKFGIILIGGDTNRSSRLVVDVFLVGEARRSDLVLRSTARPGDTVFVSGALGGSRRGKHLTFTPRIRESRFLVRNFKVTSMIDLSDGLAMDLHRVAAASRVGALLLASKVPRAAGTRGVRPALFDGEDFELLFTLGESDTRRLKRLVREKKIPFRFTPIGRMTDLFSGVKMVLGDGRLWDVPCRAFRHF